MREQSHVEAWQSVCLLNGNNSTFQTVHLQPGLSLPLAPPSNTPPSLSPARCSEVIYSDVSSPVALFLLSSANTKLGRLPEAQSLLSLITAWQRGSGIAPLLLEGHVTHPTHTYTITWSTGIKCVQMKVELSVHS